MVRLFLLLGVFFLGFLAGYGQMATLSGKVENENGIPLEGVNVLILGKQTGIATNTSGAFSLEVKAGRAFALIFSFTGYVSQQRNFYLNKGEAETVTIRLLPGNVELENVTIGTTRSNRQETGLVKVNPKFALLNPSPITGIESLIKVLVGSNNELSSQYNVRGGSFDENLVYLNDFEVFRPYLIRNGQQEGLSILNPELAKNVDFYNGGFQARFGDKMSSVLDVQYKKPSKNGGGIYVGLLEQGAHIEGVSGSKKPFSYLIGLRNRNLRNLLSSQETKGNYLPSSSDIQCLLQWQPSPSWQLESLVSLSKTAFTLEPQESQQTASVFTPYFQSNIGLDIAMDGREDDRYQTTMVGFSATKMLNKGFKIKGMLSYFSNNEAEHINIGGSYLFGDREFDNTKPEFGLITNPLGAGAFLNYSRNELQVSVWNGTIKATIEKPNHFIQWGQSVEYTAISDKLNEFTYQDSAGYSLPFTSNTLQLSQYIQSTSNVSITRFSGYLQDNILFPNLTGVTVQAGIRYNYNTLNQEVIVSPRMGASFTPKKWKKDVIFKGSFGIYQQPPFYREMRRYDGTVNKQLKAQRSIQMSAGMDYAFAYKNRPFRWTSEIFYKKMDKVVPYDVDNVRLRYFGENQAIANAYGLETRLYGELVKDAESWLSFGWMKTTENLSNDFYFDYYNQAGELITGSSTDKQPVDSNQIAIGNIRRPTDRRLNVGIFFSDYLTTDKNFKVFMQTLYGSNLPYNIPGSSRYRNALEIPAYLRVDVGFSYQLLSSDPSQRRSHNPFRNMSNMWLSLEVFNLLDRANTISYQLIKDFDNNTFAVPNRLTPRLINLKLVAKW